MLQSVNECINKRITLNFHIRLGLFKSKQPAIC